MRDFNTDGVIVGRPYQAVNEESQIQKYPIGTIYEAFGKRWRYCRAAEAISPAKRGGPNIATSPWTGTDDSYGIGSDGATVTGIKGSPFVDVAHRAHLHTLDEFQGGIMCVFPAAPLDVNIYQFRIIGNDLGSSTTLFRAYVDPPLPVDFAAVPVDISPSPYMNVGGPLSVGDSASVVVVPEVTVQNGYFFWGQTRGPCWVTSTAGWTSSNKRNATFTNAGVIVVAADVALPYAGYIISMNHSDDDCVLMLQLE